MTAARLLFAVVCGGLFGFALAMGDMVNPARVLAFLDIAGNSFSDAVTIEISP